MSRWLYVCAVMLTTTLAVAVLYRLVAGTWAMLGAGMLVSSPFLITRLAWQQYRGAPRQLGATLVAQLKR